MAIAGVPVLVVPVMMLQRFIHKSTRSARAAAARISTRLDEIFHGINPIKLNNLEEQQDRRFRQTVGGYVRSQIRSEAGQAGVPAMMDPVAALGVLGVLVDGGFQVVDGAKHLGEVMSFSPALAPGVGSLRRMGKLAGAGQGKKSQRERGEVRRVRRIGRHSSPVIRRRHVPGWGTVATRKPRLRAAPAGSRACRCDAARLPGPSRKP